MPRVQRSSDAVEVHSEKAFTNAFGGLVFLAGAGLLFYYRGTGMFVPLASVFGVIAAAYLGYATYCGLQIRKVTKVGVTCPICNFENQLVAQPESDFLCVGCNRMIPIQDHKPLPVQQVRCGFCNELNYYSEKTDILLCEACNHEVPISRDDDRPQRTTPSLYAVVDDDNTYELVLVGHGNKVEDLTNTLQHMLALNRNQVKQMLSELPVTLLTGITRKKAEMLRAQIQIHDGEAEFRALPRETQVH